MKKLLIFCLVPFMLLLLQGCVSVSGLYHNHSFTYQSMVSDRIGVGGVVSAETPLRYEQQTAYASYLRASMINRYPGLNVMPSGDAARAIGIPAYRQMIRTYEQFGAIPSDNLKAMHKHVTGMRYLTFARIEQNIASHDSGGGHGYISSSSNDDVTDYNSTRNMTVKLEVYDLTTGRVVWSGSITESQSKKKRTTQPHTTKVFAALAQAAVGSLTAQYQYPPFPSTDSVLRTIFKDFMSKFVQPPPQ